MTVICLGDSNTYGYDPRSFFGGRYPPEHRWVDILADKTGWEIRNEGVNGQEVPHGLPTLPVDTRLLLLMLGTNDLLQGRSVGDISKRMERFIMSLPIPPDRVVLIAPPPMVYGEWVDNDMLVDRSIKLSSAYEALAERLEIRFVNAGEWNIPMCFDGVHFTEDGHRRFAEGLFAYLNEVEGEV